MKELRNSEKLYDRYADAATALVMDQYLTVFAESLKAEDFAPVEISAALNDRCRKLIRKGAAKELYRSVGKNLLRGASAAVIVFLFLCGVFAVLFSTVEAIRVPVINFFTEQKETASEVTDKDENEYVRDEDVLAGLAPEGYEPQECKRTPDGNLTIRYADAGDGFILYDELPNDETRQIDTEDAVTEEIQIGGADAILVDKEGYRIIWYSASGEVLYQLKCNQLSREETIAIAEAIESRREEALSAESDSDPAESVPSKHAPAAYDNVPPDIPIISDYSQSDQTHGDAYFPHEIHHVDVTDIPVRYSYIVEGAVDSDFYATLFDMTDDEFIWTSVDGEETGNDSIGWTVLP